MKKDIFKVISRFAAALLIAACVFGTAFITPITSRADFVSSDQDFDTADEVIDDAEAASAQLEEWPRLVDAAELLMPEEISALNEKLDELSIKNGFDITVITLYSLEGQSPQSVADDLFDYCGYGMGSDRSGVLLLHSPEERDWYISTRGICQTVFSDAGIEYIGEELVPYLQDSDWIGHLIFC